MEKKMKKIYKILLISFIAGFVISCASIVKPGFSKVKKIAIVSLQMNKDVYLTLPNGARPLISVPLTSMVAGAESHFAGGNPFFIRLLTKADEVLKREFDGLPKKYQVISGQEVFNNPAYQQFVAQMYKGFGGDVSQTVIRTQKQTIPGYQAVPDAGTIINSGKDHQFQKALIDLAKKLGVDGVALVDLNVYYQHSAGLVELGSADARVGVTMFMVNADNEEAIVGSENGGKKGPLALIGGNVLLNNDTYPMFESAMRASISDFVSAIGQKSK